MAPDISDIAGVVGRARFVQHLAEAARLDGSPPARHNALVAGLVVLFWEGHNGAMGLPDVIWTGKGVATGWAGFSLEKLQLLAIGTGQYLLAAKMSRSRRTTSR